MSNHPIYQHRVAKTDQTCSTCSKLIKKGHVCGYSKTLDEFICTTCWEKISKATWRDEDE